MKKLNCFTLIMFLLFGSFMLAEKIAELPRVERPFSLVTDGKLLYIVEGSSAVIHIYKMPANRKAGSIEHIKDFGSQGQGPGEFTNLFPPNLTVRPEELVIISVGKVSRFSRDGVYKGEKKFTMFIPKNKMEPVGKNYIGLKLVGASGRREDRFISIDVFDADLKKIKTIGKTNFGNRSKKIIRPRPCIKARPYENKIFLADTNKGLCFDVFDSDGTKLYRVEKKYEKKAVSSRFKEETIAEAKKELKDLWEKYKKRYEFREYFPAMENFQVIDNHIYIKTYHRAHDRGMVEYIVMDLHGNNPRSVSLPYVDTPSTIKNNRFYYLLENEAEEMWELHSVKIL